MDVMTLDEAIKRAKELAEKEEKEARCYSVSRPDIYRKESCENRAEEHRQLAEWLKDYKQLLEQDPKTKVLDKIRAEIEQITDTMGVSYNQYISKNDVLQIIDKYKAGSEDKG